MKKNVFLFLLSFVALTVCAQDPVEYNGLWYTLDANNSTATVVANPTGDGYSGEITIPDAVEYGGKSYDVTRVGDEAFCGTNILSVTTGNKMEWIGNRAFAYSTVASAVIGKGVTVGAFAFYDCRRLADVIIGNGEDSEYYCSIGESAFHHCTSLSSVILGKSVSSIDASVFFDCKNLKDVYCLRDNIWGYGVNFFDRDNLENMTLHFPKTAPSYAYNSFPWSSFKEAEKMESSELVKCATPQITYANGVVSFTCETEGVEFVSHIEVDEAWFFNSLNSSAPLNFTVSVFAVKKGCLRSETAVDAYSIDGFNHVVNSNAFKDGDVNKDGKVNVGDHVKLSEIILAKGK
jgi:hypothetical protein